MDTDGRVLAWLAVVGLVVVLQWGGARRLPAGAGAITPCDPPQGDRDPQADLLPDAGRGESGEGFLSSPRRSPCLGALTRPPAALSITAGVHAHGQPRQVQLDPHASGDSPLALLQQGQRFPRNRLPRTIPPLTDLALSALLVDASQEKKLHIFERLAYADFFERFLGNKYNTAKRFGLDGSEAVIPGKATPHNTVSATCMPPSPDWCAGGCRPQGHGGPWK